MLRYVMLCYVMLCYVMLCYVVLCYVMLCFMLFYVVITISARTKYHKTTCNSLPGDEHSGVRNMSKTMHYN